MKKGLIFRLGYDIISHADKTRPFGQAAKTSPSHGENGGSIPPGVTKWDVSELLCNKQGVRIRFLYEFRGWKRLI